MIDIHRFADQIQAYEQYSPETGKVLLYGSSFFGFGSSWQQKELTCTLWICTPFSMPAQGNFGMYSERMACI